MLKVCFDGSLPWLWLSFFLDRMERARFLGERNQITTIFERVTSSDSSWFVKGDEGGR